MSGTGEHIIRSGIRDGAAWQRRLQDVLREHPYPQDLREAVAVALDSVLPVPRKVRAERITDGMVEAFVSAERNRYGPDAIRAGMAAALVRRELERRTEPELHPINLDPYPATVGEVADEIARFVLELDESGAARNLADLVLSKLRSALDA